MGLFSKLFGNKGKLKPEVPQFRFELEVVEGKNALKDLDNLIVTGQDEGFSSVLIGGEQELIFFEDQFEINEQSFDEIILSSKSIDVNDFFQKRVSQDSDYYSVEKTKPEPNPNIKGDLTAHLNPLNQKPLDWIFIAKIPELINYQIPAHLSYGNWNECPSPEEHVALWKYWYEKYDVKIVCVTHDIIEAKVLNPPMDYDEALLLAREQFMY